MPHIPTLKQYCDNYAEGVASAVSGCNSYLSSGFSNVGPLTSRMKNIALGAAFGWTSIVGGIYLIRLIRGYFSPEEDDSFYSHSPEVAAYHLKREAKKTYKRGPREATYQPHGTEDKKDRYQLQFSFTFDRCDQVVTVEGGGVPICDNKFITNLHHFYRPGTDGQDHWMPAGTAGVINYCGNQYSVVAESVAGMHDFKEDAVIIEVHGKHLPPFPNTMRKFLSDEEVDLDVRSYFGRCILKNGSTMYGRFSIASGSQKHSYLAPWTNNERQAMVVPTAVYKLDMPSKPGDCGVPLIGQQGKLQDKIS